MKFYVFGTGEYADIYSKFINENEVICYLDNSDEKNGKIYRGKIIRKPEEVDLERADAILVFVSNYSPIIKQLVNLGVKEERMHNYRDLNDVLNRSLEIYDKDKIIYPNSITMIPGQKRIFLLSHDLSRTGVPVAVMHMAELFRELGCDVIVGALTGGPLEHELREKGIKFVNNMHVIGCGDEFKAFINSFDMIFIGTLTIAKFSGKFAFFTKPIIWWFNEKYIEQYEEFQLPDHRSNMYYFADGNNTIEVLKSYYPERNYDLLFYFLPDEELQSVRYEDKRDYIQFLFAAFLSKRKGHDLLIDAVKRIPIEKRERIRVLIVGRDSKSSNDVITDWEELKKDIPQIQHIGEVSQKKLEEIYSESDVFVCPSRDDTIPIVVTQAFQHSMPCIVSDHVGQSEYMMDGYAGLVFENEDIDGLSSKMMYFIDHMDEIKTKGAQGRELFDKLFSKTAVRRVMEEKILSLI